MEKEGRGEEREEIKVTHQILLVTNCQINWIKGRCEPESKRSAQRRRKKLGKGRGVGVENEKLLTHHIQFERQTFAVTFSIVANT